MTPPDRSSNLAIRRRCAIVRERELSERYQGLRRLTPLQQLRRYLSSR
jgi:hypothetical protein